MDDIDFGFINKNGITIYRICFNRYLDARCILEKPKEQWLKLIPKVEKTFFWLVKQGKKKTWD